MEGRLAELWVQIGNTTDDVDNDENVILNWIVDKYKVKYGLRLRSIVGFCDNGGGLQLSTKILDVLTAKGISCKGCQHWATFSYLMFVSVGAP
jgi:hypothetical protein